MAWFRNGEQLITAGDDALIHIWEIKSGKRVNSLKGHLGPITSLSYSPSLDLLASKSKDDLVHIWSMTTGECETSIEEPHSGYWMSNIDFHPLKPILASLGKDDAIIRIWGLNPEDTGDGQDDYDPSEGFLDEMFGL
jgi:WD40 repeat protein